MSATYSNESRRIIDNRLIQLQKITAQITADITNLNKASNLIVDGLSELFNDSSCAIRLYDEQEESFSPQVANGILEKMVARSPRPDGLSRYVLAAKKAHYLSGDEIEKPIEGPAAHKDLVREQVKAVAYLPLYKGDDMLGMLYVVFVREQDFPPDDKLILELFAQQAAIAIANAQAYIGRIKTFEEIGTAITTKTWKHVARLIVRKAREITQADYSGLWRVEGNRLFLGAMYGEEFLEAPELPIDDSSINGHVSNAGLGYVCFDVESDPYYKEWKDDVQSSMAVPLLFRKRVVGTLCVESVRKEAFSLYHVKALEALAVQAAIALENMRLFYGVRNTVLQSAVPTFVLDSNHDVLYWNKACEELTGYSYKDMVNTKKAWKAFYPEKRPVMADLIIDQVGGREIRKHYEYFRASDVIDGAYEAEREFPDFGKRKQKTWLFFTASPLRDAEGNITGAIETLQDITKQKDIESTLESRAARLEELQRVTVSISEKTADTEQVLKMIVNSLERIYPDAVSVVWPYDDKTRQFGDRVINDRQKERKHYKPRSKGTTEFVVSERIYRYVDDVSKAPPDGGPSIRKEIERDGVKSAAHLPLIAENEVYGVLHVNFLEQHHFSDNDKQILRLFATQAGIAIKNSRLYYQRTEDIATLQDINDAVLTKNKDEVLQLIVDKAVDIMPGEYGELWLQDKATQDLVLDAVCGPVQATKDVSKLGRLKIEDPLSTNVVAFKSGESLIWDDRKQKVPSIRIYKEAKSSLVVPLKYEDETIGTFNIESAKYDVFLTEQIRLLESLADQAAIAIKSAEVLAQRELLERITLSINAAESLDDTLQEIVKGALDLTGAVSGVIHVIDYIKKEIAASYSYPEGGLVASRFSQEEGLTWDVYQKGKLIEVSSNLAADAISSEAIESGIKTIVGLPVKDGEKVIGALFLNYTSTHTLSPENEKMLFSLTHGASIAIENAQLNDMLARKVDYLSAVAGMGKALTASVDLDEQQVVELIHQQLSSLIYADNMYIALYDAATDMVSFPLIFVDGKAISVLSRKTGAGRTEHIIETKKHLLVETREESEKWYAQSGRGEYLGDPLASWIGVPMISGAQVIGVVAAYHKTDDYVYSKDDVDVLQAIANQSAIALEVVKKVAELKASQNLDTDWL